MMEQREDLRAGLSHQQKISAKTNRRTNKLLSLRFQFEKNTIKDFEQIFAIMSETSLSSELGISFYTFRKKVYDPGEFTVSEMMRFAELIGVKYQVIADFVMARVQENLKKKKRKQPPHNSPGTKK